MAVFVVVVVVVVDIVDIVDGAGAGVVVVVVVVVVDIVDGAGAGGVGAVRGGNLKNKKAGGGLGGGFATCKARYVCCKCRCQIIFRVRRPNGEQVQSLPALPPAP